MSDSDLKDREETSAEELENEYGDDFSDEEKSRLEELDGRVADEDDEDESEDDDEQPEDQPVNTSPGLYRQEKGRRKPGGSKTAKKALTYGGPMLIVLILFVVFMILIGSLKAVHFATIMRTTGFAASQFTMRQAFSEVAYTDWADANDTAELPKSKLLDRLRGQDMRKIQQKLADEGKFKYTKDAAGNVNGFDLQGEKVRFDDLAKKMGKESFDDLTIREKLTARKYLTDKVKFEMGDTFDMETRGFRNGFWKGFREATDIKMTFFRDIVRDKFGKGTIDESANSETARVKNERAGVKGETVDSTIPAADEAGKGTATAIDEAASKGIRVSAKKALGTYLEGKGSSLIDFEAGMSQVSTAVLVSSLYCIGHDLSHTSDRINQQAELTMARFGHQQQTVNDQIRSGDVTSADVAYANKEWGGDAETPDASTSPLYQEDIGNSVENKGLDGAPRMNMSVPFLDWLKPIDEMIRTAASGGLNHLPLVGNTIDGLIDSAATKACGVIMNPYAQGGILFADLVVSVVTLGTKDLILKGLTSVAFFAGFAGLGKIIENYIQQIAGGGVSGTEQGADKYTAGRISTDYLNSQTDRGVAYGAPESSDDAAASKGLAMAELKNYYRSGSIKDRYFAITNPMSLLGLTAAKMPTSSSSFVAAITALPSNLGAIFSKTFSTIGMMLGGSKVFAANEKEQSLARSNDYFGVNQWGWTTGELKVLSDTNIADNAAAVEQDMDKDPSYYSGLAKCYASDRLLYELAKDDNCKADKLSKDGRALQWRIYKLHEFAVNQMSSEGLNEN